MPVWLVTGGSGFLGRHLLAALKAMAPPGADIIAIGRRRPGAWPVEAFRRADLDDLAGLSRMILDLAPEVVFHTAGQTPPADPVRFYRGNTRATVHLLESLRARRRPTRIVL